VPETGSSKARPRLTSGRLVALCVLFTVALRVPFLDTGLMPDEAGMLIIAQNWSEGPFLYGDYIVGRGILVVLFYALGDLLGGPLGVRLLACLVAAAMVVAAGWAGHQLRGRAGAGWAALVAAAYSSTYAFASEVMNERLLAAGLVMVSCAVTLSAVSRRSPGRAVLAGVLAGLPLLVVQSYVDGFVFAAVVLGVAAASHRLAVRDAFRLAAGGLVGAMLVAGGVAIALATTWLTAGQLWFQMFGLRVEASRVVGESTEMPAQRLEILLWLAAVTGLLVLVGSLLTGAVETFRRTELRPTLVAVIALFALTLAGIAAGGDYWQDYLLQPIPALAMATALVAPSWSWSGINMRIGAALAAAASIGAIHVAGDDPFLGTPANEEAVGRWVGAGSEPDDTGLVLWGKASVLQSADLTSPYPYLWSLLTRTLDPDLDELVSVLSSDDAPTWVVRWHDADAWGLDSRGDLDRVLAERYEQVGEPCGRQVFLLRGERRGVPADDDCRIER
jgi:hypothetical protein